MEPPVTRPLIFNDPEANPSVPVPGALYDRVSKEVSFLGQLGTAGNISADGTE
jgi:hypothetical protein